MSPVRGIVVSVLRCFTSVALVAPILRPIFSLSAPNTERWNTFFQTPSRQHRRYNSGSSVPFFYDPPKTSNWGYLTADATVVSSLLSVNMEERLVIASSSSVPLENNNIRTYPGLIDPRELSPQPGTSRGLSPSSLSRQHWRYVIFLNFRQTVEPFSNMITMRFVWKSSFVTTINEFTAFRKQLGLIIDISAYTTVISACCFHI